MFTNTVLNEDVETQNIMRTSQTLEYFNIKEAFAALSLGCAYMATQNKKVRDVLESRLHLSSD